MKSPVRALGLVRDLFFRSKLEAIAGPTGAQIGFARNLDIARSRLAEGRPDVVFVDLSDPDFSAEAISAAVREHVPDARLVGFASHVDLKALRGAREAGFSLTLSRSEFTVRLAGLLRGE